MERAVRLGAEAYLAKLNYEMKDVVAKVESVLYERKKK